MRGIVLEARLASAVGAVAPLPEQEQTRLVIATSVVPRTDQADHDRQEDCETAHGASSAGAENDSVLGWYAKNRLLIFPRPSTQ